jgi:DNA-binding NarL/FixJ family response regulator
VSGTTVKQGSVLLANHHLSMLEGIHRLLESRFAAVVMVADERSLIDAVNRIAPDLAVVDLSMPVAEGTNIARQLKRRYPTLPVIVLSVHDEPTVADELTAAGMAGFVLTRTAATDLIPAIETVLKGGTYVSRSVRTERREAGD